MRQDDLLETVREGNIWFKKLNHRLIDEIRKGLATDVSDEDAAHALLYLLIDDLPHPPDHGILDNPEAGAVLRCIVSVLWRLGIEFEPPFHDKHEYEIFRRTNNYGGEDELMLVFAPVRQALDRRDRLHAGGGIRGLRGDLRTLIFAAEYKPEIVWRDVAAGTIEITKNKQHCLLYDRPVGPQGLTWGELLHWWRHQDGNYALPEKVLRTALRDRLVRSLKKNEPEQLVLDSYWRLSQNKGFDAFPALLPQVFLHFDPIAQDQRRQRVEGQVLPRQRMDFLLLAPGGRRYVLEVDGKHHYSRDGVPAPDLYAEMVREDRRIRLQGYEVYRFGGAEFRDAKAAETMLSEFFRELLGGMRSEGSF
ncbi:hypothetical protein [Nocardiopsis sp. RV163]|uniref:hypothetical protein n=1 Tax=Nocardiopsis sp. RV163 TaxID=1661388 RepID=UPI000A9C241D|nr:hypothetical protein [Nocardiopsis sp. RV163]